MLGSFHTHIAPCSGIACTDSTSTLSSEPAGGCGTEPKLGANAQAEDSLPPLDQNPLKPWAPTCRCSGLVEPSRRQ